MCSPLPFPLTIVKLSLALGTRPSSCGTLWPSASSPFRKMVTAIGYPVCVSRQTTPTQSSCLAVGIAPSRSGTWLTVSWKTTTTVTMATWIPWLSHPTVRSAHPVARTPRPCFGILMMARTCTLWNTMTSSTLCVSPPTVTGCASLMVHPSRYGIWHARRPLRSSAPRLCRPAPRPIHHNVCLWLGPLTARLCSLATLTRPFAYGKSLYLLTKLTLL